MKQYFQNNPVVILLRTKLRTREALSILPVLTSLAVAITQLKCQDEESRISAPVGGTNLSSRVKLLIPIRFIQAGFEILKRRQVEQQFQI